VSASEGTLRSRNANGITQLTPEGKSVRMDFVMAMRADCAMSRGVGAGDLLQSVDAAAPIRSLHKVDQPREVVPAAPPAYPGAAMSGIRYRSNSPSRTVGSTLSQDHCSIKC